MVYRKNVVQVHDSEFRFFVETVFYADSSSGFSVFLENRSSPLVFFENSQFCKVNKRFPNAKIAGVTQKRCTGTMFRVLQAREKVLRAQVCSRVLKNIPEYSGMLRGTQRDRFFVFLEALWGPKGLISAYSSSGVAVFRIARFSRKLEAKFILSFRQIRRCRFCQ